MMNKIFSKTALALALTLAATGAAWADPVCQAVADSQVQCERAGGTFGPGKECTIETKKCFLVTETTSTKFDHNNPPACTETTNTTTDKIEVDCDTLQPK